MQKRLQKVENTTADTFAFSDSDDSDHDLSHLEPHPVSFDTDKTATYVNAFWARFLDNIDHEEQTDTEAESVTDTATKNNKSYIAYTNSIVPSRRQKRSVLPTSVVIESQEKEDQAFLRIVRDYRQRIGYKNIDFEAEG